MNEQKKAAYEYYNPKISKQTLAFDELYYAINNFINNNKLNLVDLLFLDNMLKQLRKQKGHIKIRNLRALEEKFKAIEKQYKK